MQGISSTSEPTSSDVSRNDATMPKSGRTAAKATGFGAETDTRRLAGQFSCPNDAWFGRGEVASRLARGVRDGKEALTPNATRRKDYLISDRQRWDGTYPAAVSAVQQDSLAYSRHVRTLEEKTSAEETSCDASGRGYRSGSDERLRHGKKRKSERTDAPCGSSAGGRRRTQPRPRRARRRAQRRAGACS